MLTSDFEERCRTGRFRAAPVEGGEAYVLRYSQGGTRLLVSVAAPRESRVVDGQMAVTVSVQGAGWPRIGRQRHVESLLSSVMEQAIDCEAYPEADLSVRVVVLATSVEDVPAMINGGLLAAAALGLCMRSTFFCFCFPNHKPHDQPDLIVVDLFSDRVACVEVNAKSLTTLLDEFSRESTSLKAAAATLIRSFFVTCLEAKLVCGKSN